jgi:hypothetical protein
VKPRLGRRVLVVAVLLSWVAGLILLARRRQHVSDAELLARGVLRLAPGTYFYTIAQSGRPIGFATSTIDTSARGFVARDIARLRTVVAGDSQSVIATSTAYLSRRFALDSFALVVSADERPMRLAGRPEVGSSVLLPTLAPIALMLSRTPRVGEAAERWVYNPIAQQVERVTLRIAAESLFTVPDSAVFDAARRAWTVAHADTVRAWKIVTPSQAVDAWVDSQGRIVAASEAGGASIARTTYEIATLNPKLQSH